MEKTFNGVVYESKPEIDSGRCTGCAGFDNNQICIAMNDKCVLGKFIWIEKAKQSEIDVDTIVSYGVDYFYCDDHFHGQTREEVTEDFRMYIQAHLNQKALESDPEYQKYLELKKKFEI